METSSPSHFNTLNFVDETSSGSLLMQDIYDKALSVARLEKHVLLIGEMGVGKKHLARMIHKRGSRTHGPFESFYCIDIDEAQFKEAFCEHVFINGNHINLKYDLLEKASQGTLYIDEFAELKTSLMYNIIDSYRIGCNQLFRYHTQAAPRLVISIKQDSYKRILHTGIWNYILKSLNPISIMVPPLRERKEDILSLIHIFLERLRFTEPHWKHLDISNGAIDTCLLYNWPGNIRQLKNALTQGAILSCGQTIENFHLPFSMSWNIPYSPS